MPLRRIAIAGILGGLAAAVLWTAATTGGGLGGMITLFLAPLPIFLAGLSIGERRGGLAAAIVAVLLASAVMLVLGGPLFAGFFGGYVGLAPLVILAVASYGGATKTGAPRADRLVWGLVATGVFMFLACDLALAGHEGGLKGTILRHAGMIFAHAQEIGPKLGLPAGFDPIPLVEWLPGSVISLWLSGVAFNGILALGIAKGFGRVTRPVPQMAEIEANFIATVLLAAAVLARSFGGPAIAFIGDNLFVILALGFVFSGLAVVHSLAARYSFGIVSLVAFYIVFMGGGAVILIAFLGLIEQWAGLRMRMNAAPGRGEK